MKASSTELLVAAGTEKVKVNTPIAVIRGDGDAAGAGAPQISGRLAHQWWYAASSCSGRCSCGSRRNVGAATARGGRARGTRLHRRDRHPDHARGASRCHGRRDAPRRRRVPDGRRGGAIPGRLQDQPGIAGGVRRPTRHRYADHRAGFCRHRRRRGHGRPETHRRVHDLEFRHAGDRPDHQLRCQDALHVRWPDGLSDCVPRTERRGGPRRRPAQPMLLRPGMRTCPV